MQRRSREKLNVEGGEGRHRGWWRGQRGSDTRKAGWEHTGQSFKTDAQDQSKEKEEAGHVSPRERIPALLMGPAAGITWAVRIPHCQELESPHPRGRLPQALVPPSLPQAGCRGLQALPYNWTEATSSLQLLPHPLPSPQEPDSLLGATFSLLSLGSEERDRRALRLDWNLILCLLQGWWPALSESQHRGADRLLP